MLIDWFTVGAQAVNFIVLVWLLKRFLYKPVLNAIDAREQRIAHALADAERQTREIQKSRNDLQAEHKTFDDQRAALLTKAELEATAQSERLLGGARQAAESLTSTHNAALLAQTAAISERLARLATSESVDIARAALKDLADVDLEERIGTLFARRLRTMEPKARDALGLSLKRAAGACVVASSFALSDRAKTAIQTAVNETCSADIPLQFEISSAGVAGIELTSSGQRLSWTVGDYLQRLEEKVAASLKAGTVSVDERPAAPTEPLPREETPAAAA